ncbi:RHS repeat-associated core domain-containing protein (plasmid) [Arthrobacter sp. YA7-1]|uniref:RHS repeat-associated core domain-containing protein n=1 Tax=Arthrobacter sp. YA7-1 TaxID=2987701 RepID=UPI002227F5E4|nr:RHS repeat-associated core domain-containing protein [Arthrobacter sp. YA7-1]UYY83683.1 RHS repeat-associated core domain-containing protein [Arthrobacter sp. YA7-1]
MRTSTGASFYYTIDGLGSTILLTDSTQTKAATYSYDSWGNTTSSGAQAATNPWTYAGGYNDTTNNRIKFGARYYNPYRGRFTQPDPSGQEANRYTYAGADPANRTDPSGLGWGDVLGPTFGIAVTGMVAVAGAPLVTGLAGAIGLGILAGGLGTAIGAGTTSFLNGDNPQTVADNTFNGLGQGAIAGAVTGFAGSVGGLVGKILG